MTKVPTIHHLVSALSAQLRAAYQDPLLCQQYAWWIIEAITKKNQAHLIAQETDPLSSVQEAQLQNWVDLIINKHMPLQYLLGTVPFADLTINVTPPILIPRPETEEWVIALAQKLQQLSNQALTIVDLCCGSGCIALTLARALPASIVWAIDISPQAIALTQENAALNNIHNVRALQSDLFTQLPHNIRADLIVSNPPYVPESDWQHLDESVTRWEDKQALVAPDDGLAIIKNIITQAPAWINPNEEMQQHDIGQLYIEIGYQQGKQAVALMQQAHYNAVRVEKDLAQKDRVVSGRLLS